MKNIQSWAVASVVVVLGACTTEATTDTDGGMGATSTTATGTTTTSTTTTGGTGGGSGDDGGTCAPGATPTSCETCAFAMCKDETCACDGVADCKDARGDYFTCLGTLDGGNMESCATSFVTQAGPGAGKANDLATCMGDKCQDMCH